MSTAMREMEANASLAEPVLPYRKRLLSVALYLPGGRRVFGAEVIAQEDIQRLCDSGELDGACADVLLRMVESHAASPLNAHDVRSLAERLGFLSRRGMAKGFPAILPRGMHLEACVDTFNQRLLDELEAEAYELPDVYDASQAAVAELTEHYEHQERVYHVAGKDGEPTPLRLSYAADPLLFTWLGGRRLLRRSLPYTCYTRTRFLRHFQSGELNGLDKVRQFSFPELHTFLPGSEMARRYVWHTHKVAWGMERLFGRGWVQRLEIAQSLVEEHPSLLDELSAAVPVPTIVYTFDRMELYYRMKTMLVADAGYQALMLYNLQWDELNGRRFNITMEDGEPSFILHASLAGGMSRLLPCLLGQALLGRRPQAMPTEFSRPHLTIFPVGGVTDAADIARRSLGDAVHYEIDASTKLVKAIANLKQDWQPYFAVVGPQEAAGAPLFIQDTQSKDRILAGQWLERYEERLRWFRPATSPQRRKAPPIYK